jgi:hypothetical protein
VKQLSETGRLALLHFKQLVLEKGLDVGSMAIYEVVLPKHITDEQAFLAFLAQR